MRWNFLPSFSQSMTPREILEGLNRLVDIVSKLTGLRNAAAPLNMNSAGTLQLDDSAYRRIPARLTGMNSVTITGFPNQNRYSFVEQVFDATYGIYFDLPGGMIGDGVTTYATELNNATVSGSFSPASPPAAAGTGPFVWLKSKGVINGAAVYEFNTSASPGTWVAVTSTTPQQVLLGGRQITDAVLTAGSPTISSPKNANFTSSDYGKFITGPGIPQQRTISDAAFTAASNIVTSTEAAFTTNDVGTAFVSNGAGINTTIASVQSVSQATLNQVASSTLTGQTANIGSNTTILSVVPAVPPATASTATLSQNVLASADPATVSLGSCFLTVYLAVIDSWVDASCGFAVGGAVYFREVNGRVPNTEIYQCRLLDTAVDGVQVWATRFGGKCDPYVIGPFTVGSACNPSTGQSSSTDYYICAPTGDICSAYVTTNPYACLGESPPPPPPPSPPPPPPPPPVAIGTFLTQVVCGNGTLQTQSATLSYTVDLCGNISGFSTSTPSPPISPAPPPCPPCPPSPPSTTPPADWFFFGSDW